MFKNCTTLRVKYIVLIGLVFVFFLAELIVGIFANSITLQTDAFHMLTDMLALIIGYASLVILKRKQHHRYTYGWSRTEIIAGMINSVFLLSMCFMLIIENIEKIVDLVSETENDQLEDNIDLVLYVAAGGLLINFIGLAMFYNEKEHGHGHSHGGHGHSHGGHDDDDDDESRPVQNYAQAAVLLHIIGDTLGSVLVIISSLVIKYNDFPEKFYLDPLGSIVIIIFISISSLSLLWKCIKVLMHKWTGDTASDIKTEILTIDGVDSVHEFHVWALNNKVSVASMHIQMEPQITSDTVGNVMLLAKDILHRRGIHSSTIQPEWSNVCAEPWCGSDCSDRRCCKED
jgi:zinc transporter 1